MTTPIILVPGFWLGAWAWDEVAAALRSDGHDVIPLTLPGLDPDDVDRSAITQSDHVDAVVEAIRSARGPVVLVVHSGAGFTGYAASDRVPDRIAAMVYVDTGPGKGAMDPAFEGTEMPLPPPDELAQNENLDGLTDDQLDTFRRRSVPEPGGVLREAVELTNDARRDVPTTVICTAFTAAQYQAFAKEDNPSFLAGFAELQNVAWVDLPTSHWPMWSRPTELAAIISEVAKTHRRGT